MVMEGEGEVKGLTLAALAEEEEEAEAAGIQFADDYESDFESQANRMVVEGEEPDYDSMTVEEEAADLANREIQKSKTISNLRNSNGVDYAPWMNISAEDEAQIQRIAARRAAERRAKDDDMEVRGKLLEDSVGQELSGGGLKAKAIAEDQVELEWSTSAEANTAGYVIKRRMSKQEDWDIISDYRRWGPLVSKGKDGGTYRYLDSTVDIGTYLYRVSEADLDGKESDLCQVAVDVQSKEEQLGTKLKAAVIVGVAVLVVQTALNLDPIQ